MSLPRLAPPVARVLMLIAAIGLCVLALWPPAPTASGKGAPPDLQTRAESEAQRLNSLLTALGNSETDPPAVDLWARMLEQRPQLECCLRVLDAEGKTLLPPSAASQPPTQLFAQSPWSDRWQGTGSVWVARTGVGHNGWVLLLAAPQSGLAAVSAPGKPWMRWLLCAALLVLGGFAWLRGQRSPAPTTLAARRALVEDVPTVTALRDEVASLRQSLAQAESAAAHHMSHIRALGRASAQPVECIPPAALAAAEATRDAAVTLRNRTLARLGEEVGPQLTDILAQLRRVMLVQPELQTTLMPIVRQGEIALRRSEQVLDIGRLEAGQLMLKHAPFYLRAAVGAVCKQWQQRADHRGIEWSVRGLNQLEGQVRGDARRVQQVLDLLLDNAFNATDSGDVSLQIKLHIDNDSLQRVKFVVSDSGAGMTEARRAEVLAAAAAPPFSLAHCGLGLGVASRLLALMGSQLQISSQAGSGTECSFVLDLPTLAEGERDSYRHANAAETMRLLEGRRAMLLDTNPASVEHLHKLLDAARVQVVVAESVEAAIQSIAAKPCTWVIVDMQAPMLGAYALARRIRASAEWRHIPVIGFTANAVPESQESAIQAGVTELLLKPITAAKLYYTLARQQNP